MIRLFVSIFVFCSISFNYAYSTREICQETYIHEEPIFVTDLYKTKGYYNDDFIKLAFRDSNLKNATGFIPRGSIVSVSDLVPSMLNDKSAVRVRLVNTNTKLSQEEEDSKHRFRYNDQNAVLRRLASSTAKNRIERDKIRKLPAVKEGDQVFVRFGNLKKSGDYKFYLEADTVAHYFPSISNLSGVFAVNLKRNKQGKYKVLSCCKELRPPYKSCVNRPIFELLHNNKNIEIKPQYQDQSCYDLVSENLTVFPKELTKSIESITNRLKKENGLSNFNITDFDTMNWRGMIKFPMQSVEQGDKKLQTQIGPYGSFHYKPDDKVNSDLYVKPHTACSFARVLKAHQDSCQEEGCELQFGDMYHSLGWKKHLGHANGECLDIRPLRKFAGRYGGLSTDNTNDYDREKTFKLLNLLKGFGGETIFDDYVLKARDNKANRKTGQEALFKTSGGSHKDHIHVCFKEDHPQVKRACELLSVKPDPVYLNVKPRPSRSTFPSPGGSMQEPRPFGY